ncbi:MAG TPA: tetratricopeptide repeat protein [Melioribacteraceae bacterium]|nr:tetratricopeptide repeat protein [Melioribacteraceae bacterium]
MKIKPLYLYIIGIFVVVIAIIFINGSGKNKEELEGKSEITQNQMPDDETHRNLKNKGGTNPSKENVNKEAMQQFEMLKKTYETNPNDTANAKSYASMLAAGHHPEDAVKIFEDIIAKDKKRIDILLLLTMVNYNLQNYDKAEDNTKKILALDKNHSEAYYNLGAIYAQQGKKEDAKKIWENIIKKYPNTQASKYAVMALNNLK